MLIPPYRSVNSVEYSPCLAGWSSTFHFPAVVAGLKLTPLGSVPSTPGPSRPCYKTPSVRKRRSRVGLSNDFSVKRPRLSGGPIDVAAEPGVKHVEDVTSEPKVCIFPLMVIIIHSDSTNFTLPSLGRLLSTVISATLRADRDGILALAMQTTPCKLYCN